MESVGTEQVSWNLSQMLIIQIGNLLSEASKYFIMGSISDAFVRIQSIRMLISHDLSEEELSSLLDLENKYGGQIINGGNLNKGFKTDDRKLKVFTDGRTYFIQYHGKVMNSLKKHGYSIPPKQDSSKMF